MQNDNSIADQALSFVREALENDGKLCRVLDRSKTVKCRVPGRSAKHRAVCKLLHQVLTRSSVL